MKNKKFIAFIAALSIFFGTILSIIGDFNVYANEKDKLIIGQIINEESKKNLDSGVELDYKAEKISDEQMKINIKVNATNEEINTEDYFIDFSFLDYFDILEEKIKVTNPELDNDEFKKSILETKVVENKETVIVNLDSIDKSGTEISFTVKLKNLKDVTDKTQLELKAQLKRNEQDKVTLVEELQKIKVEVLKQKEVVIDDTTNQEEVEIDLENEQEIKSDKIGVEKTINPVTVEVVNAKDTIFEVTLNVTNKTSRKKKFTVIDYIDTDKFEFVEADGAISKNEVTWEKEIKKDKSSKFVYKIKFKNNCEVKEGKYITNPKDKKGEASYKDKNKDEYEEFENVSITVIEDSNSGEDNKPQDGELKGEKSVLESEKKDGTYDITFDITGTPGSTGTKPADIVLMIDNSGSMSDKVSDVKRAATRFAEDLLTMNNANIRISVGKFDQSAHIITNSNGSCFSSDVNLIKGNINSIKASSGTNTQDAIAKINLMLNQKRENANSYVLLFTDGLPFDSNDSGSGVAQHMANAKKEYNKYFAKYPVGSGTNKYKDTEFYSVGVISGGNTGGQDPVEFLNNIQNVAKDKAEYEKNYYSSDVSSISKIFERVTNDIKGSINNSLATYAVLSDEIAAEFEYVQGQEPIVTTVVNGTTVNLTKGTDYTFTVTEKNKIVFNFPKIPVGGVKVTFKIKPANDYFGTYDKDIQASDGEINTNGSAILDTKEFEDISFDSPTVKIPYKKGTIKIIKNIKGEALSSNDKFIIGFNGPSRYNVEINGAGQTTLDFYLKDDKTDIGNNDNINLNYMLAGAYNVNELVPMNYSNDVKFEIKVDEKVINGKTFTLDKDNTNIEIIVTNKVVNKGFLNDRSDKSNIFSYQ